MKLAAGPGSPMTDRRAANSARRARSTASSASSLPQAAELSAHHLRWAGLGHRASAVLPATQPAAGGRALATILVLMVALLLVARARERARYLEDRERVMLGLHDNSIQSSTPSVSRSRLPAPGGEGPGAGRATLADAGANLNLVIQDLRAFITRERRAPLSEQEFMLEIERMVPPPEQGARASRWTSTAGSSPPCRQTRPATLRMAREAVSNSCVTQGQQCAPGPQAARRKRPARGERRWRRHQPGRREARLSLGLHHIQARARKLRGKAVSTPSRPVARASSSNSYWGRA